MANCVILINGKKVDITTLVEQLDGSMDNQSSSNYASELFESNLESNPELANEVYKALGFEGTPYNNLTFDELLEEVSFEDVISKDTKELYNANRSKIYLDLINKISPNTKLKIVKNLKIKGNSVNGVYTFKGDIFISRDTYK